MTKEVVGIEPLPTGNTTRAVEFDLGELPRQAGEPPAEPPEPLRIRLRRWSRRPWSAAALALLVGVLAAVAGWHVGGDRRQAALENQAAAHPGVFGWVVGAGPNLASGPDDPRVNVNLHLANLSPDPVQIRSVAITTDHDNASVQLDGYRPAPIAPEDNTIAQVVIRPTCTTTYDGAFLDLVLTRLAPDGSRRTLRITAGADGRIGDLLGSLLDQVCAYPTRDDPESGVDGLVIDQTSGARGATLTITNHSKGVRRVQITSDEGPAFQLVSSLPDAVVIGVGEMLEIRLEVRVLHCNAIVGLRDWASSIVLEVTRVGDSIDASGTTAVQTGFGLPDLMLVPGGAAIQKTCGS
jgi:hypothetical protein